MLKGPRAILSSAIANALGEYFDVCADDVESNLLGDASIVLRNARLKERKATIVANNGDGKSTTVTITGCVEEASFSWSWSTSWSSTSGESWVDGAVLAISGAKFQARLEHADVIVDDGVDDGSTTAIDDHHDVVESHLGESSFVDPAKIDGAFARQMKEQRGGGLAGYVERQVKMVVDALTLKLVDFELRIVLPPESPSSDVDAMPRNDDARYGVLTVGVDEVEVLSFGREEIPGGEAAVEGLLVGCCGVLPPPRSTKKLKQSIHLRAFSCVATSEGGRDDDAVEDVVAHPLLEPFSYSADIARLGERFGGFLTGLEVVGSSARPASVVSCSADVTTGMTVRMGRVQTEILMQLGVMLLSPPEERSSIISSDKSIEPSELSKESSSSDIGDPSTSSAISEPSSFTFPLPSISLVMFEEMRVSVFDITCRYVADGTVCSAEVAKFAFESDVGGRAEASEIAISMRPIVRMTVGCIENLVIPDKASLSTPIRYCEVAYEGSTLMVRLKSLDVMCSGKEHTDNNGVVVSAPKLPCNINIDIEKEMQIKSEGGALTEFGRLHLYALKGQSCTKIAIQFESFRNYLLSLSTVSFCGTLPLNQPNVVEDFVFAAGAINMERGHSTDEWAESFGPRKKKKPKQTKQIDQSTLQTLKEKGKALKESGKIKPKEKGKAMKESGTSKPNEKVLNLPFASIADLKITLKVSHMIGKIKDTTLIVKAYRGKGETTSKDLVNYYAKAILSRAPDFISNAELLGLNVVDSTAGMKFR